MSGLVASEGRVLVVGAHLGALAIPISRRCREVVAIEANPDTFALLELNIALNKVSNVVAHQVAASDYAGRLDLLLSRANSGGSKRVPIVHEFMYYYDRPRVVSVPAAALDEHLDEGEFELVVMDIEGSEPFALRGMQKIVSRARHLAIEFVPHHLKNVGGVSVRAFLDLIEPHFDQLAIPSQGVVVPRGQFFTALQSMYEAGLADDGLVFSKTGPTRG